MRRFMLSAAMLLVCAAPAVAAEQPKPATQCLAQLRDFDSQLVGSGYGVVGPGGYGVYTSANLPGIVGTAEGQMRMAMRTAEIFGMNGDKKTCEAILSGMRKMRKQYEQAGAKSGLSQAEIANWRKRWLEAAVPVSDLKGSIKIDNVVGSALRNTDDAFLGRIQDVLVAPRSGQIEYALVSRGGFLGIGAALIPVPWNDLKMTALPYRDTFVLNVTQSAMADAPQLKAGPPNKITPAEVGKQVDRYWSQHLKG
jgi:hypothetical protein